MQYIKKTTAEVLIASGLQTSQQSFDHFVNLDYIILLSVLQKTFASWQLLFNYKPYWTALFCSIINQHYVVFNLLMG